VQRLRKVRERYEQALKEQHPEATKLRAVMGYASEKADGQKDYAAASKALEQLEKLLGASVGGGNGTRPVAGAASDTSAPSSDAPDTQTKTPRDGAFVALQQSRLAWEAARKKASADLLLVKQTILEDFDGEPEIGEAAEAAGRLEGALATFDMSLTNLLDRALTAADTDQRRRLHVEAGAMVTRYRAHLAANELLSRIDDNPFVAVSIHKSLDTALKFMAGKLA